MTYRSVASQVHELLDRTMNVADFWDSRLHYHELVRADPELNEAAGRIADMIGKFYQLVGQRMPDRKEPADGGPGPAGDVADWWRCRVVPGRAQDHLDVRFEAPSAGWIRCRVPGLTDEKYVGCSYIYDPFPEMIEWLEAICDGASSAIWQIDEEGSSALFIYHADLTVMFGQGARLIHCVAGEEVWRLSGVAVTARAVVEGFYRAFCSMVESADFVPGAWEMAPYSPAISPDIYIYDLPEEDQERIAALGRAYPYGGTILRCLYSKKIEAALRDPEALPSIGDWRQRILQSELRQKA